MLTVRGACNVGLADRIEYKATLDNGCVRFTTMHYRNQLASVQEFVHESRVPVRVITPKNCLQIHNMGKGGAFEKVNRNRPAYPTSPETAGNWDNVETRD